MPDAITVRRVVGVVIYSMVSSLVAWYVSRLLREQGNGAFDAGRAEHVGMIREAVIRPSSISLSDVGGLQQQKQVLRRAVVLPLRHPHIFFSGPSTLRPPKGILLHGPPGTGKTMLARALASEAGVPMLALSAATLENKYWGESAKLIRCAFMMARTTLRPCIIFFDEIDGIGRTRGDCDQSCVYSLKTELLQSLDGVGTDAGRAPNVDDSQGQGADAVIVLACTNCPKAIDPAIRRRLPLTVEVPKPDLQARLAILTQLASGEPDFGTDNTCNTHATLKWAARHTEGFTGSDLSALYSDASAVRMQHVDIEELLGRARDGQELLALMGTLDVAHFREALGRVHGNSVSPHSSSAEPSTCRKERLSKTRPQISPRPPGCEEVSATGTSQEGIGQCPSP